MSAPSPDRGEVTAPLVARRLRLDRRIGPLAHPCLTFSFVIAGSYRKVAPGGPVLLRAGHVSIAEAGMRCAYEPEQPTWLIEVAVSACLDLSAASWLAEVPGLRRLLDPGPGTARRPVVLDLGADRVRALVPYLDALAASAPTAPVSGVARFAEVLEGIVRACHVRRVPGGPAPEHARLVPLHMAPSLSHRPAVLEAMMLMHEQITRPWDGESLARAVSLSASQLRRLFHEDAAMSPMAYLAELRLRRMAYYLRRSGVSVAEAATACGLPDASYAARRFRTRFGTSPGAYRAALTGEVTPPLAVPGA